MSLSDRQKELAGYLVAGGWPLVSACASVGNATQENLCNPLTKGAKDHGSDGLYQWRLGRLDDLMNWSREKGLDWQTMKTQAAYHQYEMARDYKALNAELIAGAKPIETLTANICNAYERPSPIYANLDGRIKYAKDTYALMQGVKIPSKVTPTVVTTGAAASGTVIIALWQFLANAGPGTATLLFTTNLVLGGIVAYLAMKLATAAPVHSNIPSPASTVSDVEEQLQKAIADKDAAAKVLADATNAVLLQKDAMAKVAASLQDQVKQAEELSK